MDTLAESDAIQEDASGEQATTDTPSIAPESTPEPTPSDPDSPTEQEITEQPLSPREEAMSRIVSQVEEQEEGEDPDPDRQQPSSGESLTVKVDGIEKQIPIDEAIAIVQKNQAADKRLNDAALKQQQLNHWEQQLAQREQQLLSQPSTQQPTTQHTPQKEQPEFKELVQTAVDKLYDGDTDEAVDALTQVISGRNNNATPAIDPAQISAQATEQVMQTLRQREFDAEKVQALGQFSDEYKELAETPELFGIADGKTIELMQQHPDWTPTQVIMEAGRMTQDLLNNIRGNNGSQPSRTERKAQLNTLPRSQGSVAFQPKEPDTGPTTDKGVIADMKRHRGQAS